MPNEKPSTQFTRAELRTFALAGVREKVRAMEREIARLQREFPDVFISADAVVLLTAEARTDGKDWLLQAPTTRKPSTRKWSAAVRKQYADRMRKLQPKLRRARRAKQAATTRTTAPRRRKSTTIPMWRQLQAALQAAPDQQATSPQLMSATGATSSAVATNVTTHPDIFKRLSPGVFTLTAAGKKDANGATPD